MFTFNNTEERWFCSWVVMRRKFLKSQENVKGLLQDIKSYQKKINNLIIEKSVIKEEKSELQKSNHFLRERISKLEIDFKNIKTEAQDRSKMINKFNQLHNMNGKRKKKRVSYKKR